MGFIDTYKELREIEKYSLRQKLRNTVIQPISYIYNKLNDIDHLFSQPRVQFLYIHHVFKDEETAFEKLVERLSLSHHFISHSEAVNKILSGNIDKPYIAISSDDGLKNNINAANILDRFGIKGCFFICPEIIDEKRQDVIAQFSRQRLHFPPVEFMSWVDIEKLMRHGHEIGGHTMNHVNLAGINEAEAKAEIEVCYKKIVEKCGSVKHFAYPYGRFSHFNNQARKLVFETGFESCASAERGCHIPGKAHQKILPGDLLIRRDHVVLNWSLEQIQFFMLRNIKLANFSQNYFPYHANIDINQ